jgi:hypothetical protein
MEIRQEYKEDNKALIRDFKLAAIRREWVFSPTIRDALESLNNYPKTIAEVYEQSNGSLNPLLNIEGIGRKSVNLLKDLLTKGNDRVYEEEIEQTQRKEQERVWRNEVDGFRELPIHLDDRDTKLLEEEGYVPDAPDLDRLLRSL